MLLPDEKPTLVPIEHPLLHAHHYMAQVVVHLVGIRGGEGGATEVLDDLAQTSKGVIAFYGFDIDETYLEEAKARVAS